jgi:hypothetical protein
LKKVFEPKIMHKLIYNLIQNAISSLHIFTSFPLEEEEEEEE